MPVYQVKDANGVIHEMKGPAGLTSAQVTHFVYDHLEAQRQADEAAAAAKKQAEQEHLSKTGFFKNLSAGLTHGKGAAETYLGEVTGSQALKDWGTEAEAKARGIAEPTTAEDIANAPGVMSTAGRWAEKNLLEPTGQFLGSWAAPIAAGVAGTLAAPEEAAVGLGGLAIRGLAGKAAATAVGAPIMAGEDIQRQKEAHPDQQVNLLSTSLAGAAQSALFAFMPGAEKVHELIGPTVKAEADTLARKVIDGEMTAKEAQEALTGRTINYARSAAAHTVNAAGVMVGNEAIARAGAGQNLTDEDARNAYLESLKAAAVLGPAAGLFGAGRGEALGTIEQARLRNAKINQINAERAQQNLNIRDIKEQQAAAAAQAAADKEAQLRVMPTQQGQLPFETTVEDVAARRTETTPQIDMFNQSPDATMTMPTAEPAAETASPTKLDHDTLTSFGFKKNSIAYKALEKLGDAADNPELFNAVIEKNDHLIKTEDNQAAVDKFRSTLDANRQVEDTGAANEPGLTGETNQPSVPVLGRGKRGAARVAEEPATGNVGDVGVPPVQPRGGETGKQAPLNLGDIVESGGVKFAKTENGFQRVEGNVPAAEKPAEVAPAAETAEPTLKPNVSAQEKVQQRIAEERAAAEQARLDEKAANLEAAKAEQAGWEGRQATMTEAEKEGLQAAKEAEAGEDTTSLDDQLTTAKANLGESLRQVLGVTKSIVPGEEATLADVMKHLGDVMYILAKKGVRSMSQAIKEARDSLGIHANKITNEQYKEAFATGLNKHIEESKVSSAKPTLKPNVSAQEKPAPNAALNDILKRSGSEHEAEPVTSNLFKDAVNDPGRIAVETKRGIAHALTKFETMVFSSNAALNKALREGMKRAGITWEAMAHAMYNASDSQALHAQGVANEFIQRGDIRYDPLSHKYIVSGDGKGSWVGVINAIKEAAAAHGVPKDEMEQYAHRALEAKRLKGLSERNDTIRARVRKLQAKGKRADAEKLESKLVHIHMSDEQIKAGMEFFDKIPELKKIEQEWHTTRGKVLDFLVDTGITDREHADELMEAMDYVPFQRVEQIMNGAGYKEYSRGLLDAAVEKRLKGSEQPVNNIFDNMERWISYSIRRGINNKTAVDLTDLALKYLPDETREVQKVSHGMDSNTISVWRDGKKHMYEFDDPLYVHAFTGIQSVGIPAITAWSKFANLLRQNIVLNPLFSIGQLSQDAFGAMFTSGVKHPTAIPLEVMKEFIRTLRGTSGAHEELKAMGAVGHRDYSAAVSRIDAETEAGLRDPKLTDKLLKPLRHLSMASDNAVRQAIYNRTLLETGGRRVGKNIVGGDKAMAAERAFEVINFRRAGASQATTMLRQTVPFFGAYLQAMNVAAKTISGRGIAPTERAAAYKTLASTTAKVMALGFIYNSLISEDEDYKKLDPAVRDRLLLIPGSGGMHVPLRQDIFTLIAKVIPEHIYQMTMAEGTEDATKAKAAIGNAVMASLLSPNMIAQGAKPVIEVMTNHDFFTGRPIVGMGIDEREPYLQYSGNTSELSKLLGSVANISPMKIDHLLKAYTGYTGSMALMATSALVSAGSGKEMPDKELQDQIASIPGMSAFVSKEFGTRDLNDYYELRTIVNTAVKSYNNLKNTGRIEEAMQYRKEHADVLKVESQVNRINQALSKLRKQESILQESDKTGAEKEAALREIQLRRHKMLQNIDEVRKSAGL